MTVIGSSSIYSLRTKKKCAITIIMILYFIIFARLPIVYIYIIVEIPTHASLIRGGINIKNTLSVSV